MIQVFIQLGPSTLEQTAPGMVMYVENIDYNLLSQTDPGDVTGSVTAVDLDLGLGNASTSGVSDERLRRVPSWKHRV